MYTSFVRNNDEVPENAEGRQILLDRVAAAKAAGDSEGAARSLIHLAKLVKWIGPVTDKPWYEEYVEYVNEAHELLEGSQNKKLLASAHRAMDCPIVVPHETGRRHLEIALELSKECGDDEGRGHALYRLSHYVRQDPTRNAESVLDEAQKAFELASSHYGLGLVQQTRGVRNETLTQRERGELLVAAAGSFEKDGSLKDARRALMMALTFGSDALTSDEIHAIGDRCIKICQSTGSVSDEASTFRRLSLEFGDRADKENEAWYASLEDALDVEVYGSRLARLESDLEIIRENIPMAQGRAEKKKLKDRAKELEVEIETERGRSKV